MRTQFVVQVENRPGAVSHLFHLLALRHIDLHHVGGLTAGPAGLVVLAVSDDEGTRDVLTEGGYAFSEGESLVVRMRDRPGALAEVTDMLARAGVNILTMLEVGRHGGSVDIAFTVDDAEQARAVVAASEADAVSWH